MSLLSSIISSPRQLSVTFPPSNPKSANTSHFPSVSTGPDSRSLPKQDPGFTNTADTPGCGDTKWANPVSNDLNASSTRGNRPVLEQQTPFRKRANTAGEKQERKLPFRKRANTTSGRTSLSIPAADSAGKQVSSASTHGTTSREASQLKLLHPQESMRRVSSDSGYLSPGDSRRSSSSPNLAGVLSDTESYDKTVEKKADEKEQLVRTVLTAKPQYSHTSMTKLPERRAKTASYATGPQGSDHVVKSRRAHTAQDNAHWE
ncbi:hypothetical protein BaRGS_00015900 [Batillaria attramentaria]|uniref:Uncharacterized protein n=1 Tax=Batillaria attramentaria TaxID=370345 RepID=A0ABD0L0B7_9CAEN